MCDRPSNGPVANCEPQLVLSHHNQRIKTVSDVCKCGALIYKYTTTEQGRKICNNCKAKKTHTKIESLLHNKIDALTKELEDTIAERDMAITSRDIAFTSHRMVVDDRNAMQVELNAVKTERDMVINARELTIIMLHNMKLERDAAIAERDIAIAERKTNFQDNESQDTIYDLLEENTRQNSGPYEIQTECFPNINAYGELFDCSNYDYEPVRNMDLETMTGVFEL